MVAFVQRTAQRIAALGCVIVLGACDGTGDTVISIDPSRTHQRIEAWEANARLWEFDKGANRFDDSWLAHRDAILRRLILDEGITRLRLEIRSGAENPVDYWSQFAARKISYTDFKSHFYEKINDNVDPDTVDPAGFQFAELDYRIKNIVVPAMEIARRYNRPMTINLNYVDFRWTDKKGSLSHADRPAEYAELIAATYAHLQQRWNLTPDVLEIILEPDNSDHWRGRQIGEAMVETARRFRSGGREVPKMIAPSTARAAIALDYVDAIARVPEALPLLTTLSYHRYDIGSPDESVRRIGAAGVALGKQTAMLEHVDSDAEALFDDLLFGNVSAWQLYGIASKGGRRGYLVAVEGATGPDPRISLTPIGVQLAQITRHVRPGAVRIGATASRDALRVVAFRNPDGGLVTVIKPAAPRGGRFEKRLRGLVTPAGRYGFRISGIGPGPQAVWRADREGLLTTCLISGPQRLAISTGEVLTIAPPTTDMQAKPCQAQG